MLTGHKETTRRKKARPNKITSEAERLNLTSTERAQNESNYCCNQFQLTIWINLALSQQVGAGLWAACCCCRGLFGLNALDAEVRRPECEAELCHPSKQEQLAPALHTSRQCERHQCGLWKVPQHHTASQCCPAMHVSTRRP